MKSFMILSAAISLLLFSGCSDNSGIVSDLNSPCPEDAEEILSLSGSPGAPVLYLDIGSQSANTYLYWAEIESACYEIEECDCPAFTTLIYSYYIYNNNYRNDIKNRYYYRVRAITATGNTGWSNVVMGSHGGWL